jgi:hypothetical protein
MTVEGATAGCQTLSSACTVSKVSRSVTSGTSTAPTSPVGFGSLDLDRSLHSRSPMQVQRVRMQ